MKTKGILTSNYGTIEEYLGLNVKLLSIIGLEFSLNNNKIIKTSKSLQKTRIFLANVLGFLIAVLEIFFIRKTLSYDTHLAARICSELFSNVLCISKGFGLASAIEQIQMIFDDLTFFWNQYRPNKKCYVEILSKAEKSLFFCKCYVGVMISGIAAFSLPPLHNFASQYFAREITNHTYDYSKRIFFLLYPFEVNSRLVYFSILFEEQIVLIISAMLWINCDTLFAQLTTHTYLQFQILQYDIENLIDHENLEVNLTKNIIIFIKRHQGLLRICKLIEYIFSPVILTTMLLSAMNICVNMFEFREMLSAGNNAETALYAIMVIILFFQIIFYCIFAESLTEQTGLIAKSIYNCKWTEKNHRLRFYLQMIIMNSQTPFYCTAYGFFPIGHERFASIISTSFSYYMMLQTMS